MSPSHPRGNPSGEVLLRIDGAVAVVTLDVPSRRNVGTLEMARELSGLFEEWGARSAVAGPSTSRRRPDLCRRPLPSGLRPTAVAAGSGPRVDDLETFPLPGGERVSVAGGCIRSGSAMPTAAAQCTAPTPRRACARANAAARRTSDSSTGRTVTSAHTSSSLSRLSVSWTAVMRPRRDARARAAAAST